MIHVVSVAAELNFGGGESRLLNFARVIDRSRFRHTVVTIFAPNSRDGRCGSLRSAFEASGVDLVDLAVPHPGAARVSGVAKRMVTAGALATAIARLRRLFIARHADVVDAHLEGALYTAVPAAASAGIPATITLYSELDLWKIHDGNSYRAVVFPPIRRFTLGLCSALISDSAGRCAEFARCLGDRAPPLYVIPNGMELQPPVGSREETLDWFGIPRTSRSVVLGQVAGLVPYKGQHLLLKAAHQLVAAGHDVRVLLVGDERMGSAYPNDLRAIARWYGIADRLHMRAYPGNIADAWRLIDIHVHASSVDSLPNAVIEGMSLGKPAVVSAVGALPEHVDDGRTGLVVPPHDVPALTAALRRLLEDRAFAMRLGEAARARYRERFTPGTATRQMEACLDEVARRRRGFAFAGGAA